MLSSLQRLRGRKCHVYCLGAAKTGTTSIAQMMSYARRSAHEPEVVDTNNLIIQYLDNSISPELAKKQLQQRDKRLYLEFEASHPLGYVADLLVELYPEAKFVVSYREPKAWLKSRLNFHLGKQPEEWKSYRDYIWKRHFDGHTVEEKVLKDNHLFSLAAYLKQYTEQYQLLIKHLPPAKTLLIATEEINTKATELAKFCGIDTHRQPIAAKTTNQFTPSESVIDHIDAAFVEQQIELHCSNTIAHLKRAFSS